MFSLEKTNSSELEIQSDRLEVSSNNRVSIFLGNVYARDGVMQIWTEKLIVKLYDDTDSIEKIIAEKNVNIKNETITANSKKAIYYTKNEVLKLYGDVEVVENSNVLTGDEFILDLIKSTSIMKSSSSSRVKAVINQIK